MFCSQVAKASKHAELPAAWSSNEAVYGPCLYPPSLECRWAVQFLVSILYNLWGCYCALRIPPAIFQCTILSALMKMLITLFTFPMAFCAECHRKDCPSTTLVHSTTLYLPFHQRSILNQLTNSPIVPFSTCQPKVIFGYRWLQHLIVFFHSPHSSHTNDSFDVLILFRKFSKSFTCSTWSCLSHLQQLPENAHLLLSWCSNMLTFSQLFIKMLTGNVGLRHRLFSVCRTALYHLGPTQILFLLRSSPPCPPREDFHVAAMRSGFLSTTLTFHSKHSL